MNTEKIKEPVYEALKSPEESFRQWVDCGIDKARQQIRAIQMETCLDYPVTGSETH